MVGGASVEPQRSSTCHGSTESRPTKSLHADSDVVGRSVIGGLVEGEGEDGADQTKKRAREKRGVPVLLDRFPHVEGEQPAAEKGTEQARGAAHRLENAEGTSLPAGLHHLRREPAQRRTRETASRG